MLEKFWNKLQNISSRTWLVIKIAIVGIIISLIIYWINRLNKKHNLDKDELDKAIRKWEESFNRFMDSYRKAISDWEKRRQEADDLFLKKDKK